MKLPKYSKIGFIASRLGMDSHDLLAELRRRKIKPAINFTIKNGVAQKMHKGGHYDIKKMARYFPQLLESVYE